MQTCHVVDFLLETSLNDKEALMTYGFDSHLCPSQNVLAQPHLARAALANGFQELVMANMGLLVSRGG